MKTQMKMKCTTVTATTKRINGKDQISYQADFVVSVPDAASSDDDKRLFSGYPSGSLHLTYSEEGRFIKDRIYYMIVSDDKVMFLITNT